MGPLPDLGQASRTTDRLHFFDSVRPHHEPLKCKIDAQNCSAQAARTLIQPVDARL